jgi:hypothetical protein
MVGSNNFYHSGGVILRRALPADDDHLRAILRENQMDSWVQLAVEREPSYFDGESLMGESYTVIGCDEHNLELIAGMYSCSFLPVHVNRVSEFIGYLGELRINRNYRHKVRLLKGGFVSIRFLVPERSTLPFWFTSISSDNTNARRLLEGGLKGMPIYRPSGEMETLVFNTRQGRFMQLLQQASATDVPALVEFFNTQASHYQFSPVLSQEWLFGLSGQKGLSLGDFWLFKVDNVIKACLAIWDQRAFKQTVCRGYSYPVNVFRGVYNLYAGMTKRVILPAERKKLEHVFLAFAAFDNLDDSLCITIVREALIRAREKGADAGILGLSAENPMSAVLKQSLKPIVYRTCIETVSLPDDVAPVLAECLPQPEVALL